MGRALAVLLLLAFVAAFVVLVLVKVVAFAVKLAILAILLLAAFMVIARLRSRPSEPALDLEPEHTIRRP